MNIFRQTSKHFCRIKSYVQNSAWLLIFSYFILSPLQAFALSSEEAVLFSKGGRFVQLINETDCVQDCPLSAAEQISFIAIQNKGYRFDGWTGHCRKFLGRICTVDVRHKDQLSARFVKIHIPDITSKALLLLHDPEAKPTIWNEFVKQQFGNRCPIIYGGIVLGKDAYHPVNHVYCYRIAFGYLDQLNDHQRSDTQKKGTASKQNSHQHTSHEILAALLGIQDRHPQLSLTLVNQQNSSLAALAYLQSETIELIELTGLLTLQQTSAEVKLRDYESPENEWLLSQTMPRLNLDAKPQQSAKISNALSLMTKAWWLQP